MAIIAQKHCSHGYTIMHQKYEFNTILPNCVIDFCYGAGFDG